MQRLLLIAGLVALLALPVANAQTVQASKEVEALGVMRYSNGTPDNGRDDVFILDVNDDNAIGPRDIVLATSGYANTVPGQALTSHNSDLFGRGVLVPARIVYADYPEENGGYSQGDWVFITGAGEKLVSTSGAAEQYSIRLKPTDSGDRGTILVTGDNDLRLFRDAVDDDLGGGSRDASFTWVDKDGDGTLDVDEDAYVTPDSTSAGSSVPTGAILIRYADPPEANEAPDATLSADTTEGHAPLQVTFTLAATDANNDALSWSLDADGDGEADSTGAGASATVTHNYTEVGVFNATITVDDGQATAVDSVVITVLEPAAQEPPASPGDEPGDEPKDADNAIPGFAPVALLVALALWGRRRA